MKRYCIMLPMVVCCIWNFIPVALGQEKITAQQEAFFEKHIRPALSNYCYECHSIQGGRTLGGLLLDTRESIRAGGDSGPAVQPSDLDNSVLWDAINWASYEMPPKQKMPDDVIDKFKQWIKMGAPDPRERETFVVESNLDVEAGKKHWAFQPPSDSGHSIDHYIGAKLKSADIQAAGKADPLTLLRRLTFDLVGLPPSAQAVREFTTDYQRDPEKAIDDKIDHLLSQPQFGERWGRYWLDVARYAESSGKTSFTYPHAWRYRDYVIDAFNKDTPYDEFVRQQIAGDLMPAKNDQIFQENLLATGFLTVGAKALNERNPRVFQMDQVDEQIDTVTQSFLGLTVSCARCHDHKYDPIPMLDYYAMAGIFLSTDTCFGTVEGQQNHRPSTLLNLPVRDEQPLGESFSPAEIRQMKDRIEETQQWMRARRADANNGGEEIVQREMVAARNKIKRLQGKLAKVDQSGNAQTVGMGVQDSVNPKNARVLKGGDVEKPAQEVDRGFLQVLDSVATNPIQPQHSGRQQLAQWLTSSDNPLTARVMVNRIWLKLFGEGLVRSPNNWGLKGERPTHPELLDHLAVKFMNNGWSVKQLIKSIVSSEAYQRSSVYNEDSFDADSENKLIWRMPPRQLDAEALRDSILAVGGLLQYERPLASEIAKLGDAKFGRQIDASQLGANHRHRAVYMPIPRDSVHESLSLFDFADTNAPVGKRDATNVASQALYLMNSPLVISAAQQMAAEILESNRSVKSRVKSAFMQAYGRSPTQQESIVSESFLTQFQPADIRRQAAENPNQTPMPSQRRGQRRKRAANGPIRDQTGGGRKRRPGAGGRQQQAVQGPTINVAAMTPEQQAMTLLCQSLIASAEFRIIN